MKNLNLIRDYAHYLGFKCEPAYAQGFGGQAGGTSSLYAKHIFCVACENILIRENEKVFFIFRFSTFSLRYP